MTDLAYNAIDMLLRGARHPTVLNYIDRELRKKRAEECYKKMAEKQ